MTPDDIAEARAVIDAATDGPWWLAGGMKPGVQRVTNGVALVIAETFWGGEGDGPVAPFIAAARDGWPRALDALEAAQEGNDSLGAMVEWLAEVIVDARDACQRAESIEPTGSPEWVESGIAMRTTVLREVRAILDRERNTHPSALDKVTADRDEWRENALTLRGLLDNHAHNDAAMEQALRDVTVERDDLRAAHERLDRDARAVAGRSLHYEARAEKAEAAIERVRSWCDDYDNHQAACAYWQPFPTGTVPVCDCSVRDLRAALDGEA